MENMVQPNNPSVAPAAPVEPTAPTTPPSTDAAKNEIPDDVARIPAIQAVLAGQPPAVSANITEMAKSPEGKLLSTNKDSLMKAGMGFYRSLAGDVGVLFNQMFISGQEIQGADKAGKLLEIAPPFDIVNQSVASSGVNHPVLQGIKRPAGFKTASAPVVAPASVVPAPAIPMGKTPAKVLGAKIRNLGAGSPTSGPKPGSGRILNNIMKSVM